MKILIVDDDHGTLNALKAGLISYGYQVLPAQDGHQALQIIKSSMSRTEPVALMVTDLRMPNMNGLELIRSVRQIIPGLAVILMTAYGDKHIQAEVKKLDGCGYINKPFSPKSLQEMIRKVCSFSSER